MPIARIGVTTARASRHSALLPAVFDHGVLAGSLMSDRSSWCSKQEDWRTSCISKTTPKRFAEGIDRLGLPDSGFPPWCHVTEEALGMRM